MAMKDEIGKEPFDGASGIYPQAAGCRFEVKKRRVNGAPGPRVAASFNIIRENQAKLIRLLVCLTQNFGHDECDLGNLTGIVVLRNSVIPGGDFGSIGKPGAEALTRIEILGLPINCFGIGDEAGVGLIIIVV